jgi:hypothetical protein
MAYYDGDSLPVRLEQKAGKGVRVVFSIPHAGIHVRGIVRDVLRQFWDSEPPTDFTKNRLAVFA